MDVSGGIGSQDCRAVKRKNYQCSIIEQSSPTQLLQKKVIGQNFQTVAIDNLNDVTMTTRVVFGTIVIDTIKENKKVSVNTNAPTAFRIAENRCTIKSFFAF